jgi:O-antigen/teichoic acid export membrane protein
LPISEITLKPPASRGRDSSIRLLFDALGTRLLLAICTVLTIILVSRGAGPRIFGVYASAIAFSTLLLFLTDLGSTTVVVREGITSGSPHVASRTYLQVRGILIIFSTCLGAALVPFAIPHEARSAAWLALGLLVFSGAIVIAPLGQLHGSMAPFRRTGMLQGLATVLLTVIVLVVARRPSAFDLVGASVTAAAISTVYALTATRHWTDGVLKNFDHHAVVVMMRAITLLGFGAAISALYARIDGILLLNLRGPYAAGVYSAAYRFLESTSMVPAAILIPVAPIIVAQLKKSGYVPYVVDRIFIRLECYAGIGLAFITIATGPWLISLLLGNGFKESGRLFGILAIYRGWSILAFIASAKVIHAKRESSYVVVALCGLALNVLLNLFLIPRFGSEGAAFATIVTEALTVSGFVFASSSLSSARHGLAFVAMALLSSCAAAATLVAPTITPGASFVVIGLLCTMGALLLWHAVRLVRFDLETIGSS